jgi:hypothetical protein
MSIFWQEIPAPSGGLVVLAGQRPGGEQHAHETAMRRHGGTGSGQRAASARGLEATMSVVKTMSSIRTSWVRPAGAPTLRLTGQAADMVRHA